MNPQVSILIPLKNAGIWLNDCLESISAQTFTSWECIIINDHCTDNSIKLASSYAFFDSRFRIFENNGDGLISANIAALNFAKGTFVTRMDADDLMPVNRIKEMFKLCNDSEPGTLVTGKVAFFPAENCGEGTRFYEAWLNRLCENNTHWDNIWRECVIPSPCWMIRKSDLEECGGFYSDNYPEDYDLAFRFFKAGFSVKSVPDICHYWRQHDQRFSRTQHYSAENFMLMKWKYFYSLEYSKFSAIIILGTGDKAKILVNILVTSKIDFTWVSHEKNIAGNTIHGIKIKFLDEVQFNTKTAVVSTLSSIDDFSGVYNKLLNNNCVLYRFC